MPRSRARFLSTSSSSISNISSLRACSACLINAPANLTFSAESRIVTLLLFKSNSMWFALVISRSARSISVRSCESTPALNTNVSSTSIPYCLRFSIVSAATKIMLDVSGRKNVVVCCPIMRIAVSKSTPSIRSFTFFDTRSGSNAAVIPNARAACSYALRVSPCKLKLFTPRCAASSGGPFSLYCSAGPAASVSSSFMARISASRSARKVFPGSIFNAVRNSSVARRKSPLIAAFSAASVCVRTNFARRAAACPMIPRSPGASFAAAS